MFSLLFLFLFSPAFADDRVVVTATRNKAPTKELPYSVATISGEDWEKGFESAMGSIPGVSITANGGPGQTRGLLLRGAKSEHTLVLVDGIEVNDSLSPSRGFDFGQIPLSAIDHIEVIKGPQSVLFGSDAMGGVVQIFTKHGENPPVIHLEGGSYWTNKGSISAYGFHGGFEQSDGFSAADSREGNTEKDGHHSFHLGGSKDLPIDEKSSLRVTGYYSDAKTDTDRSGGRGGDSYNTATRSSQLLFRTEALHLLSEKTDFTLAGSLNALNRDDNTSGLSYFKSYLWKIETLARHKWGVHESTAGLEYATESGRSNEIPTQRGFHSGAALLQDRFVFERFHGTLGGRIDLHSETENAKTFRLGLGYWFVPDIFRMKGSAGTGFKAPSIYQTYSTYGSRSLLPEKSVGGDIGFELAQHNWNSEILWYQNRFTHLIEFDTTRSKYYNIGSAETYGIEWSVEKRFTDPLTISNSFTTIHAVDRRTKQSLLRRPTWSDTVNLEWKRGRWQHSLLGRYVGPREDLHPVLFTSQHMSPFFVAGASSHFTYSDGIKLTVRLDNLLNRHYQETSGYGTPGFSGYAGLEYQM